MKIYADHGFGKSNIMILFNIDEGFFPCSTSLCLKLIRSCHFFQTVADQKLRFVDMCKRKTFSIVHQTQTIYTLLFNSKQVVNDLCEAVFTKIPKMIDLVLNGFQGLINTWFTTSRGHFGYEKSSGLDAWCAANLWPILPTWSAFHGQNKQTWSS